MTLTEDTLFHFLQISERLVKSKNRYIAAEAMERAGKQGQIRNFRFAQTIISDTINEIGDSGFPDPSLIKDLKECSAGLTDQEAFAADGLATIRSMSTAHYTQRSNARGRCRVRADVLIQSLLLPFLSLCLY